MPTSEATRTVASSIEDVTLITQTRQFHGQELLEVMSVAAACHRAAWVAVSSPVDQLWAELAVPVHAIRGPTVLVHTCFNKFILFVT